MPATKSSPKLTATVTTRLGDLFENTSDLVVLPCSAKGTVTKTCMKHVERFRIPLPPTGRKLGDVNVIPFPGSGNVTKFVAWAASVLDDATTAEALERIGQQIGIAT